MLSYLPRIKQQTFTLGAAYKHYAGRHVQTVSLGYNYLANQNLKYTNNDDSSPDNLTLDLSSHEQKATLRAENRTHGERWTLTEGWKPGMPATTIVPSNASLPAVRSKLGSSRLIWVSWVGAPSPPPATVRPTNAGRLRWVCVSTVAITPAP